MDLNRGILYIHLGMTGKLLWNGPRTKYARAIFELDNGTLIFDDIRQFGRVEYFPEMPDFLARSGPDALTVSAAEFLGAVKTPHWTYQAAASQSILYWRSGQHLRG